MNRDAPFVTDEGNFILDLHLQRIGNPRQLALVLNQVPGVVENGLFIDICDVVVVGHGDGRVEVTDINAGRARGGPHPFRRRAEPVRRPLRTAWPSTMISSSSAAARAGSAPAGWRRETGARVALAEEDRMGGTCVIRGCVPKKLMVFASGYRQQIADAAEYGWDVTPGGFDWPQFRRRLDAELDRLEAIYRTQPGRRRAPRSSTHRATLEDPHTVRLAAGERYHRQAHPGRHRRPALRARRRAGAASWR